MTTDQNCINKVVVIVSTTDGRKNVAVRLSLNNGPAEAAKIAQG